MPGSCARVCACSPWPGWTGRPPGRVLVRLTFSCGRSWCALCSLGPLRAWVALFAVVVGFFGFLSFPPFCAPAVSGVLCFSARGALGLGVLRSSAHPSFFFFFSFCAPPCLLHSLVPGSGCREPWRSVVLLRGPPLCLFCFSSSSPPPSLFCFLFFVFSFPPSASSFLCFSSGPGVPVVRFSGWFVCPGLWGVLVRVAVSSGAPWLLPFCVCCRLSRCSVVVCFVLYLVLCGVPVMGLVLARRCCPLLTSPGPPSWHVVVFCPGVRCCVALVCRLSCVVLLWCRVACGCWLFAAGSGCLLLFPAGVCCRGCSCLAVWLAALLSSVVCCGAPLPCAVSCVPWCLVAVWCRAVAPCCPLSFCWWCWFVSFSRVCGAVLRCASCCSVPDWSALLLVPRAVASCCVLWCLPGRSAG